MVLSNTSGTVSLRQLTDNGASSIFQTLQSVSWNSSKTSPASSGTYLHVADEANVAKYKPGAQAVWYKPVDPTVKWQVGFVAACSFTPVTGVAPSPSLPAPWQTDDSDPPFAVLPPVTVEEDGAVVGIPAADIGLKAVQLSELLPNPTTSDSTDEFIELYNPNSVSFDLSGFKLQYMSTASQTVHGYTFPDGTTVAAKGFKAFYSGDTHLSLSNSGGNVWLTDPLGTLVTQTDVYGTAEAGQAWILAAGKWQWTLAPTPNAINKLVASITVGKPSAPKLSAPAGAVKAAVKGAATKGSNSNGIANTEATTPVNPWLLAGVVTAALLYGVYEYRTDLANHLYQFRRNRTNR